MARTSFRTFLADRSGASAVEFAIVGPAFLALLFGIIECGLLIFTQASLHYAVQQGARCEAVKVAGCASRESRYFAPGPVPTFTTPTASCGLALSATVTYSLNVVLYKQDITLSATSCFPNIKGVGI